MNELIAPPVDTAGEKTTYAKLESLAETALEHPINKNLIRFLDALRSIQKTLTLAGPHIAKSLQQEVNRLQKDRDKLINVGNAEGVLSAKEISAVLKHRREVDDFRGVDHLKVINKSLFTQIFCEFDTFMGGILKAVCTEKPELLGGFERKITLSELINYESVQAAASSLLEQEIENFRRGSYIEQFEQLERRFDVSLRKFKEWACFVELGQRRNILVHNDGIVSNQYRSACSKEGFSLGPAHGLGCRLDPDVRYISEALVTVRKVAFMLSHTLWRKLLPTQVEIAGVAAHQTLFDFLQKEMWNTSSSIGEFVLSREMQKGADEVRKRMNVINTAMAHKFAGRKKECEETLSDMDWTAVDRDFRLAVAILRDETDTAWTLMRQIGKNGEHISELSYYDWPLFHQVRKDPGFHEVYAEIYGSPFAPHIDDVDIEAGSTSASELPDRRKMAAAKRRKPPAEPAPRKRSKSTGKPAQK